MDREALRQTIARMVREILDREMKAVIDAALPAYADFKKGVLVLLSRPVIGFERMMSHIRVSHPEARLHIACPQGCVDKSKLPEDSRLYALEDILDVRKMCDDFERYAHIYWLNPPLQELRLLQEGEDQGFALYAMLQAQAINKPCSVLLSAEYQGLGALRAHRDVQNGLKSAGFACETIAVAEREDVETQAHELVTEADVRAWRTAGVRSVYLKADCVVTPLAYDTAKEIGLRLNRRS